MNDGDWGPAKSDAEVAAETDSRAHLPAKPKWEFDGEVTKGFQDMLERSIPDYRGMREATTEVAKHFLRPASIVLDLGASRGDALEPLIVHAQDVAKIPGISFYALDSSGPMVAECRKRFRGRPNVFSFETDLRTETILAEAAGACLVLSVLTLQFVPIEHRQRILRDCWSVLAPGGGLVLVEKVLGATHETNDLLVQKYYELKNRNGYSWEAIHAKRKALEGVLVPLKASWNLELLADAGFSSVEQVWGSLNFRAWVAQK